MTESVNSESKEESKNKKKLIKFIFSIIYTAVSNLFLVNNAVNLTLGDKFFYFLTIMWYLYFPAIFAEFYGNPEKIKKENKLLDFWEDINFFYPMIFTLVLSIIGLTEFFYFIAVIINIAVIDIVGVVYIFTYSDTKKGIKIIGLILISSFSIIGQFYFPFTKVSFGRIILFEVLWTVLIGEFIHSLLLKYMRDKKYHLPRVIINFSSTFFFLSLLITSTAPLTISNRAPIIAVKTGSMSPFINVNDLVFIAYFDPKDIQIGSVIAYYSEDLFGAEEPITVHRVIDKWKTDGTWRFQTRGNNNSIDDPYSVADYLIYGVYWFKIPGVGKFFLDIADMNLLPFIFSISSFTFLALIAAGFGIFGWRKKKLKL